MKNLIINLAIISLIVTFCIGFAGCEKEIQLKTSPQFDWQALDWVRSSTRDYYLNNFTENGFEISIPECKNYFNNIFNQNNFIYPIPSSISNSEHRMYKVISTYVSQYTLSNRILPDYLNDLRRDKLFISLNYEEKTRVAFFIKTIIGVSEAYCELDVSNLFNESKQAPRETYNNANGHTRFERQLNNCLSYQLDGHFETLLGSMEYIAGLPFSFIWDTAICANEITVGLWEHVK